MKKIKRAQVMLEFLFCMIIIFLMIYASIYIFRWTGVDLAERRIAHDDKLTIAVQENYINPEDSPLNQLDPFFYKPAKLDAIWDGN